MSGARGSKRHLVLATLAVGLHACALSDGGLGSRAGGDVADAQVPDSGSLPGPDVAPSPFRDAGPDMGIIGPVSVAGAPAIMGCADGSREGFLETSSRGWPGIAGCAGAWSVPGLMPTAARTTRCDRRSGNTSENPLGVGCGPGDLCAAGWHICVGAGEVQRVSPSHCESVVPAGVIAFFAVAGGGNLTGDCVVGLALPNDVRGCGTLGQPEDDGCYPLDRRLEFGDCLQTQGVWQCGVATDHLREVERVFKTTPDLGGVLCCRDER